MFETFKSDAPTPVDRLDGMPVNESVKRAIDVTLSLLALALLAPLLAVIAVLVFLEDRGPIFFAHQRIGRNGKLFGCLKFRSMKVDAAVRLEHLLKADPAARAEWARDQKLRNDPRLTSVGRFLRRSSLDELPQLLNILAGDMSLVGPRPIVQSETEKYGANFKYYCAVRPGLTGLWQISGRNDVSYDTRVALDTEYVCNRTLWMDIKIICLTIPAILMRRGSY